MTNANIKREPNAAVQYDDDHEQNNQSLNTTENMENQNDIQLQAQIDAANQKLVELKSQLEKINTEKDQQYTHFDSQLRQMRNVAEEWQKKYIATSKENEVFRKRIRDLQDLKAPKTLASKRSKRSILASTENCCYEVESLLDHEGKNGEMYYLIHWKNYDSTHDTWERESNLKCAALLKRYKNANNLN